MFFWYALPFLMIQQMLAISGSLGFSKTSLNIWNLMIYILLKSGLENYDHYFTSIWDECNCAVVWVLPFFGIGMKTDLFQSCGHGWVFHIFWHIECSTVTASSFRIWNSSTGTPSPPLALFIVLLPKAHLTSHSRMFGSRWVITPLWLSELINWGNHNWKRYMYPNVHHSPVYNSQDMEVTLTSINRWADKDLVHMCSGILLS